mmetsp:Transcript_40630/g.99808  ORF Transcript_40630/g.99808 Transcript_40630/m.99808 type:complete len:406 (+) Transcript_40630:124-1341(+)|eukprot:CAMPEP_0206233204 /NCGR_PEP_ID=MMETSP0047_2-20121206/11855_1 /ASSEMBLY_ACC=CAM_ASM_000192 /TAXON_ID=195065 /ORGANISM="Chroomonas mesostigmatica_cf, Strain CCMP1168" /LENGTH=405 /DNA_ID=CAMNT_0053657053 /DNA_START=57 /DNA_END=1274 /DNA_ORIENTATION=-
MGDGMRKRKESKEGKALQKVEAECAARTGRSLLKSTCFILVGLCLSMLLLNVLLPFDPEVSTQPLIRDSSKDGGLVPEPSEDVKSITELTFHAIDRTRVHGWLVIPVTTLKPAKFESSPLPPCVVMGHGFGAQKDMGLIHYAEAWAKEGIASFIIDYRSWGGSDGHVRHLVDQPSHVSDLVSAFEFVSLELGSKVDGTRIALWGSSLAGGHVLTAAALLRDHVRAVISQSPSLDGQASFELNLEKLGTKRAARMLFAAITDQLRGWLGLTPAYVKILGEEGKDMLSVMTVSPQEHVAYFSKHPPRQRPAKTYLGGWKNMVPARFALTFSRSRPILDVPKIMAPILFIQPAWDSVVPNDLVPKAAEMAKHKDTKVFKGEHGHFETYTLGLEAATAAMVPFLVKHLE